MLLNDIKAYRVVSNDLISKMKNFLEGEGFELNEKMERKKKVNKNKTAITEFAAVLEEPKSKQTMLEMEFYEALEEESDFDLE